MSTRAIFLIILAVVVSVFTIAVHWRIKTGRIVPPSTYSYKPVVRALLILGCIAISIVLFVYFRTNSLEAALTLAVLLAVIVLGACLFGLVLEYQVKRRGGRKVD